MILGAETSAQKYARIYEAAVALWASRAPGILTMEDAINQAILIDQLIGGEAPKPRPTPDQLLNKAKSADAWYRKQMAEASSK